MQNNSGVKSAHEKNAGINLPSEHPVERSKQRIHQLSERRCRQSAQQRDSGEGRRDNAED